MALSVPWRAAQVMLIGAGPRALSLWQTATLLEILFHHANVRLPRRLERALVRAIARRIFIVRIFDVLIA